MGEIELGMERMSKVKLHADLAVYQLLTQSLQCLFVFGGGYAQRQLPTEIRSHLTTPLPDLLMIRMRFLKGIFFADKLRIGALHTHEKPAKALYGDDNSAIILLHRIAARESCNIGGYLLPSAQVKVANAEVSALYTDIRENVMETIFEFLLNVVEYL